MSEGIRRSARIARKQVQEVIKPPDGVKYEKGTALVLKSKPCNKLALVADEVLTSSQSFLVNLLEQVGDGLKYKISSQIQVQVNEVVAALILKQEDKFYKVSMNQMIYINSLEGSSEEEEESEAEIPQKRLKKEVKKPEKRQKTVKKVTEYKKGVGNPNVKPNELNELLMDSSEEPNFNVSLRINNLNFHRAAATHNEKLLKNLFSSVYKVSNTMEAWGPDCNITSLERAILNENYHFVTEIFNELCAKKIKRAHETQSGLSFVDTGEVCVQAYGVRTRKVQMSRGGREGNNALLIKTAMDEYIHNYTSQDFLKKLIQKQVSIQMLKFLITLQPSIENNLGMCIGEAVRTGNKELSLFLINHFNQRNGYGLNFLHEEVLLPGSLSPFKKPSVLKKPIENYLFAPLHVACINEDSTHLSTLLSNCDEITYADLEGRKPVHYAAASTSSSCLKVLKDHGCNLNELDKSKITPLMISAIYNRPGPAKYLIDQQVPLHFKSKEGKAAIHLAAEHGSLEVFRLLVKSGCKVDQVGVDRKTPLMFAAIQGHYHIVKEILELGGRDTKKDKCRRSALIFAVKNGHTDVVSLLLSRGSPFDEPDSSKNYPIHYAAAYGWMDCLKLLIKAGADVNVGNDWKIQPLLVAMLQGQTGIVSHLLDMTEVDVNGKDEKGRTLVSRAIDVLDVESFKQLEHLILINKADVNIADLSGMNPLHYLCKRNRPVCWFTDVSQKEKEEWEMERIDLALKTAQLLIDAGCEINICNNEGIPPVMLAIQMKHIKLAELLIRKGADLTICPSGGGVFHHLASFEMEILMLCDKLLDIQDLVDRSLRSLDEGGFTPFLRFVEFYAQNYSNRYSTIYNEVRKEIELAKKIEQEKLRQIELEKIEMRNQNEILNQNISGMLGQNSNEAQSFNFGGQSSLFSVNTPLLSQQSPGLFGSNSNSSNLFNQPIQGSLFGSQQLNSSFQPFEQTYNSLSSYLSPTQPTPQIDFSDLTNKTNERLLKESTFYIQILSKMIEKGANPNDSVQKLKNFRDCPLTYELHTNYYTDYDGLKRLKEYGPKGLYSALHLLIGCNDRQIFDYLIELELDINHQDFMRNSLIMNMYENHYVFFHEMIEKGADINVKNGLGQNLLQRAVEKQDLGLINILLERHARVNDLVGEGKTILNIAVASNNLKLVRLILENGADPNLPDEKGLTPLHVAFNLADSSANASFDMESLLLLFKSDINLRDNQGRTPLHYCFVKLGKPTDDSQIDPIESVSSACALKSINVNVQDNYQKSPLHYAAQRGAITSTMFLLSKGANLELEDHMGNTPLAESIKSGHANYAVMLVQQSANVHKNVIIPSSSLNYQESYILYTNNVINSSFGYNYNSGYNFYSQNQKNLVPGTYSMFKAAIIQGWQGLAYLLLFNGYPYMLAMQDAMTQGKFILVKTLLAKVPDNYELQKSNDSNQNLFHTLAQYGRQADHEITNLICEQLIDRGVNLHQLDNSDRSPLHYSVMNSYSVFTSILLTHKVNFTQIDKSGFTPVGYAIKSSNIHSCLISVQEFACFGADFQFKFIENGVEVTPLLHAIKSRAPKEVIKFFLDHGASLQETDSLGQNAFIYAVKNQDLPLVNALIYEKSLNLCQADSLGKTALMYAVLDNNLDIVRSIVRSYAWNSEQIDNEGKHVLHHVVQPFPYGSYENKEMLELLLPFHPNPLSPDLAGNTILTLASKQRSGTMLECIMNILKDKVKDFVFNRERFESGYEERNAFVDFQHDAELYVLAETDVKDIDEIERLPDANGNFPAYYSVVDNFDLLMTKVDLSYGPYSAYVFYRMQILHDGNRDVFVLFTRWGRIGEDGASQRTPFADRDEAVKEFCKIFKAKSGNEWGEPFEKKRGKYMPMKLQRTRVKYRDFIKEFTHELHPKTSMLAPVLEAVTDFTSQNMFRYYFGQTSTDINILNFSNLSKQSLDDAEKILYEITNLITLFQAETDLEKKIDLISLIQEKTSRYYEFIPIIHNIDQAIPPIMTENEINSHLNKLYSLKDLEIASKVILGALYRQKEINPYEYILNSLQVNLDPVDPASDEFSLILKYMNSGHGGKNILSLLRVNRKEEKERIEKYKNEKRRKLLWHGTKSMNVTSILLKGLKIAPPEAPKTGYMFGKGVYFADVFSKSLGYCSPYYSNNYFMFLCEVVLGQSLDLCTSQYIEELPEGYLSTKGVGRSVPNPTKSIYTHKGLEVPVGELVNDKIYYGLSNNEYIVYNTAQIRIRYLLHLKNY